MFAKIPGLRVKLRRLTPKGERDILIFADDDGLSKIIGTLSCVECKWLKGPVGVGIVNELTGKADNPWTKAAFLISMSGFSPDAKQRCRDSDIPIFPLSKEDILSLLKAEISFKDLLEQIMAAY